jgi:hypothetical protein
MHLAISGILALHGRRRLNARDHGWAYLRLLNRWADRAWLIVLLFKDLRNNNVHVIVANRAHGVMPISLDFIQDLFVEALLTNPVILGQRGMVLANPLVI